MIFFRPKTLLRSLRPLALSCSMRSLRPLSFSEPLNSQWLRVPWTSFSFYQFFFISTWKRKAIFTKLYLPCMDSSQKMNGPLCKFATSSLLLYLLDLTVPKYIHSSIYLDLYHYHQLDFGSILLHGWKFPAILTTKVSLMGKFKVV